MEDTQKYVLVLEKSTHTLDVKQDNEGTVLEGIFAEFGKENNNGRIYEEAEYLPHLDYLNKKIAQKKLLGELDHPEKFDISLSKVSHMIEKLEYDKDKRQIRGRIRLLDTPSGRIAESLVKRGIPIGISSRAAGIVGNDKRVGIKRIFTYDMVCETGFQNADLHPVHENLRLINESLGIDSEYVSVFEMLNGETPVVPNLTTEIKKQENMQNFVTNEELNVYSIRVKKEFDKLNRRLNEMEESSAIKRLDEMEKKFENLVGHVDNVALMTDRGIQFSESILEKLNKVVKFADNIAITLDEAIENHMNLDKKADKTVRYVKYLKENIEKGILFSEYIKECLELVTEHVDNVALMTDKGIQFTENTAQKLDENIQYTEKIAITTDNAIQYAEAISKRLDESIKYGEKLAKILDNSILYTESIAENQSIQQEYKKYEEAQYSSIDYSSLSSKVDDLINSVKKTKTEKVNESLQYGFLKLLNEAKREEFNLLDEAKKQKVAAAMNKTANLDGEAIEVIMESILKPAVDGWLENAPEEYKQIWESLDDYAKRTIAAQAASYQLDTPYRIKNFWETRSASLMSRKSEKLNENVEVIIPSNTSIGYDKSVIEAVGKALDKLPKR